MLRFGTSGLRGLVRDMTDREVFVNVLGFLRYQLETGQTAPGDPVALARDLREVDPSSGLVSSPRIADAAAAAIVEAGMVPLDCGAVPTPALALLARSRPSSREAGVPGIMVTGSHIPADRNGIKFYLPTGEVLKRHEEPILEAVARVRDRLPGNRFDERDRLVSPVPSRPVIPEAAEQYVARYVHGLGRPLAGRRIVLYEHSSVSRDLLRRILDSLGAEVIGVGRTKEFVPVDTEDVSPAEEERYAAWVSEHRADALVSTDGDGDRPLVVDERGRFHRGDVVGLITAAFLEASVAAVPVSATDAIERWVRATGKDLEVTRTRIGSPHVIEAMDAAVERGRERVVGWESNGGVLLGTALTRGEKRWSALPTRDAALPIVAALLQAVERGEPLSAVFAAVPFRATRSGLLDGVDPAVGRAIVEGFVQGRLSWPDWFPVDRFGEVKVVNALDGVRAIFATGDVVHLRPSGNAPQMRIYVVSDERDRADALVAEGVAPDGILHRLVEAVS